MLEDIKKIKEIKAIDMHCHMNFGNPFDSTSHDPRIYTALQTHLDEHAKAANIEYTFTSSFAAVLNYTAVIEGNDYLFEMVKKRDDLYQWAVVDPREPASFRQAREILESGKGVGLKVIPGYHKYEITEYGDKIFNFAAEYETNILLHPIPGRPLVVFANRYPELNFIPAHMCTDYIGSCKHKNIYTDTSGGSSLDNNRVESAAKWIPNHIMFGTDTNHAGAFRGIIEYMDAPYEVKYNLLRGNAERLFAKYLKK